jgi:hypothetical protein
MIKYLTPQEPYCYNYNLNGYRLIDPIQWNDSIWFFGCSHVYGIGLPNHTETVSYQLEKIIDFPVLNLGIPRGSPMIIKHNLDIMLTHYTPRAIIISWPSLIRWLSWKDNKPLQWSNMHFQENVAQKEIDRSPEDFKKYKDLVLNDKIADINLSVIKDVENKLGNLLIELSHLKCNLLEKLNIQCFDRDKESSEQFNWIDICADTWHPGYQTNNKIATWLSTNQKLLTQL